jgi:hypothetical protein
VRVTELDVVYTSWLNDQKAVHLELVDGCYVNTEVAPFTRQRR